jgi:hypothetical protein
MAADPVIRAIAVDDLIAIEELAKGADLASFSHDAISGSCGRREAPP